MFLYFTHHLSTLLLMKERKLMQDFSFWIFVEDDISDLEDAQQDISESISDLEDAPSAGSISANDPGLVSRICCDNIRRNLMLRKCRKQM